MKIKLAIISPFEQEYSETFIRAHRELLDAEVFYYYGGQIPQFLNGYGSIGRLKMSVRMMYWLRAGRLRALNFFEWCLYRSFRRVKIEKVLAEYGTTGTGCLKVCKMLGIPLIVHFHGYDAHSDSVKELYKEQYKEMFDYAQAVISVSGTMTRSLQALGCASEKIVYNPYGPDDSYFDVQFQARKPLLIGLGRFVDKKAPYYTILAFRKIQKRLPGSKLIIGGDGPLLETCRNLVRALGLEHCVSLPGVLTRAQFQHYLSESRAFVQHSIETVTGDMEGTPVAVLEAMAAGLPVVGQDAGILDVVQEGISGYLVDEHDVDGVYRRICNAYCKMKRKVLIWEQRRAKGFALSSVWNAILGS